MNKKITKNKNTEIKEEKENKDVAYFRKTLSKLTSVFFEPHGADLIYGDFKEAVESLRKTENKKERKDIQKKLREIAGKAIELKYHPWSGLSYWPVDKQDTSFYEDMRMSLLREYCPKTPTELSLIDIVAVAYYDLMRSSKLFNHHLMRDDKDNKNDVFISRDPFTMEAAKEASKAVDMAYRQFTNSIILLRKIRQQKRKNK